MSNRQQRAFRRQPEVTRLLNQAFLAVVVGIILLIVVIAAAVHDDVDNRAMCATSNACVETGR